MLLLTRPLLWGLLCCCCSAYGLGMDFFLPAPPSPGRANTSLDDRCFADLRIPTTHDPHLQQRRQRAHRPPLDTLAFTPTIEARPDRSSFSIDPIERRHLCAPLLLPPEELRLSCADFGCTHGPTEVGGLAELKGQRRGENLELTPCRHSLTQQLRRNARLLPLKQRQAA